jgi:hypothetical protein
VAHPAVDPAFHSRLAFHSQPERNYLKGGNIYFSLWFQSKISPLQTSGLKGLFSIVRKKEYGVLKISKSRVARVGDEASGKVLA